MLVIFRSRWHSLPSKATMYTSLAHTLKWGPLNEWLTEPTSQPLYNDNIHMYSIFGCISAFLKNSPFTPFWPRFRRKMPFNALCQCDWNCQSGNAKNHQIYEQSNERVCERVRRTFKNHIIDSSLSSTSFSSSKLFSHIWPHSANDTECANAQHANRYKHQNMENVVMIFVICSSQQMQSSLSFT